MRFNNIAQSVHSSPLAIQLAGKVAIATAIPVAQE